MSSTNLTLRSFRLCKDYSLWEITSNFFPEGKIRPLLNNGTWKIEIFLAVGIIITDICIVPYNLQTTLYTLSYLITKQT